MLTSIPVRKALNPAHNSIRTFHSISVSPSNYSSLITFAFILPAYTVCLTLQFKLIRQTALHSSTAIAIILSSRTHFSPANHLLSALQLKHEPTVETFSSAQCKQLTNFNCRHSNLYVTLSQPARKTTKFQAERHRTSHQTVSCKLHRYTWLHIYLRNCGYFPILLDWIHTHAVTGRQLFCAST